MKQLIALLCLLTAHATFAGGSPRFIANISGTVYQQTGSSESDAKVVTSPLNAKRIFDEFNVSSDDYALVVALSESLVTLVPKNSGSGLPIIPVFAISESARGIIIAKTGTTLVEAPVANSGAGEGNIFRGFRGTIFGSFKLKPEDDLLQRFSFNVTGSSGGLIKAEGEKAGAPKGSLSDTTLFKFKVSKGAPFVQTGDPI